MSVKFTDPQFQALHDSLKSDIDSLKSEVSGIKSDLTVLNNSVNRIHETLESQNIFFKGFMEDTRERLNRLERKSA